jgi:hypothetical protein
MTTWNNAGWESEQTAPEGTIIFQGNIDGPGDFLPPENRVIGNMWHCNVDVTDPYPPGQSFLAGQNIKWLGSLYTITDSEQIWKDDTSTISKINSTRDVDVSNGSLIADVIKSKDSTGTKFYDDSSNLAIDIKDGGNVGIGGAAGTDKLIVNGVTTIKGTLTIDEPTTDSTILIGDSAGGNFPIINVRAETGPGQITTTWNNFPGDTSSASNMQFNRNVNTTGSAKIQIMRANGVQADVNSQLGCNVSSFFNKLVGDVIFFGDTKPYTNARCSILGETAIEAKARINGIFYHPIKVSSLADEATLIVLGPPDESLTIIGQAFIRIIVGDAEEKATFTVSSTGVLDFEYATGNISITDTDGKFYIFTEFNALKVKNRLGSAKSLKIITEY